MKKNLLVRVLVFMLAVMMAVPAFADETGAQYSTTQDFIRVLEENDLKYEYGGVDDDNDEKVTVSFNQDVYEQFSFRCFFHEDEDLVSIRMWYIVTVTAGKDYALSVVNKLNADWKYVKFVFDESDNTLTLEMDVPLNAMNPGQTVYDMMVIATRIMTNEEVEASILSLK